MQIPMELLNKWKGLRSRGDNKKLNALLEKPMDEESAIIVFGRAFNKSQCPDHIFKVLNQFYTAKELELFPPAKTNENGK
jgi:hypothetical protein